ncbi:acyl-CoA-like ligand-binding transcription factor [Gandjariella thermophila]
MRLFREQGYAATTVEQIAEAAEVSPSTFFRYFPTKEDVVLADDVDPILLAALRDQPADLAPIQAIRVAVRTTFEQLASDQWEQERERYRLVISVPELRSAMLDEVTRTTAMLTGALAERLGRDPDDFAVRTFSGALIGAMLAALLPALEDPDADLVGLVDAALARMEAGFPL